MSRPAARAIAAALLLLLPGCASLQVSVDVLDPVYFREATEDLSLRQEATRLLNHDLSQSEQLADALQANYLNARTQAFGAVIDYLKTHGKADMVAGEEQLRDDHSKIDGVVAAFRADMVKLDSAAAAAVAAAGSGTTPTPYPRIMPGAARTALQQRRSRMTAFAAVVGGEIDAMTREARTVVAALIKADENEVNRKLASKQRADDQERAAKQGLAVARLAAPAAKPAEVKVAFKDVATAAKAADAATIDAATTMAALDPKIAAGKAAAGEVSAVGEAARETNLAIAKQTILGGGDTLARNAAAFAATLPDDQDPKLAHWAPVYNRAIGRGVGGGTDIAIKLNEDADFSVKGFVFDGRATAQMVSKVGVRAVSLIAAAYGVPMMHSAGTGGASGTTSVDASKTVTDDVSAATKADAEAGAFRAALFRVADSILAAVPEDDSKPVTDSGRAAVRAAFDNRLAGYKAKSGPSQ